MGLSRLDWTAITVGATLLILRLALELFRYTLRRRSKPRRAALLAELGISEPEQAKKLVVGLFHPYCNAGGGGERVLWTAIKTLQHEESDTICVVYTGDTDATKEEIISKASARFSIDLDTERLAFVYLKSRHLVEDSAWPRFTLLGQSLGSIVLGHQATTSLLPDIFIDTMGYGFTFPLVKLYADIPVGAYVHYPTISIDMLNRVRRRSQGHTNATSIAKSALLSQAKFYYYIVFSYLYAYCLRKADYLMVNSSWTQKHINYLTGAKPEVAAAPTPAGTLATASTPNAPAQDEQEISTLAAAATAANAVKDVFLPKMPSEEQDPRVVKPAKIVYPPCDTDRLASLPLEGREPELILSVAQFRPEKEHATQLRALRAYYDLEGASGGRRYRLVMAGSVRNAGDERRVEELRALAKELGVGDRVEFVVNPSFEELLQLFGRASVGLSTMVDEHFGINVVEFMAAGLIPLVHASGGPLLDIVVPASGQRTGFHASDTSAYAASLLAISKLSQQETRELRGRCRSSAQSKFSERTFSEGWLETWGKLKKRRDM